MTMDAFAMGVFIGFVVLPVVVFAIGLIYSVIQPRRRRQAWPAFATHLGCSYSAKAPFNVLKIPGWPPHDPFAFHVHGDNPHASNVVWGSYRNRDLVCFDYLRTEGFEPRFRRTRQYTCLLLRAPISFAPLVVQHRSISIRRTLYDILGVRGINFASDEFNRRYFVHCSDQQFALDLIQPQAVEFLLRHRPMYIEAQGSAVLFYYRSSMFMVPLPTGVQTLLDTASDFLDLLPDSVLREHAPATPPPA
jgi:hypothetical protein